MLDKTKEVTVIENNLFKMEVAKNFCFICPALDVHTIYYLKWYLQCTLSCMEDLLKSFNPFATKVINVQ